jgi:hypothetical protein
MASRVKDIDRGFKAFVRRWKRANRGLSVTVGVQPPEAQEKREGGIDMVGIAAVHEFGAPSRNIPQRSFLRSTYDENRKKYQKQITKRVGKGVVTGGAPAAAALREIGTVYQNDVQDKMRSGGITPPLSPSTINARPKGDAVPLVDTGRLLGAITVKVHGKIK